MDAIFFWGATGLAVVIGLSVIGLIFARLYVRASAERAFVRTGLGGQKVIMSGGAVVLPVFHEVVAINMNTLKLEVSRSSRDSLITKDRMRVDVVVAFFVRVKPTSEGVATAAQTLGQRTNAPEDLRALVDDKFVDALRSTAAQMTMQDLQDARENFVQGVQNTVAEDLTKNGLELESVSLTNFNQTSKEFFDPNNAFDAEGLTKLTQETERRRKERNEVEQDTEVSVREKNRDALAKKLAIEQQESFMKLEQEQQVKTRTAEQSARIAAYEAERHQEAEQSRIAAERQVQESEIQREQAVRTRKVEAEREVRVKEIEQTKVTQMAAIEQAKVTEIATQDKAIVIASKSEAQSQAQARANEALAEAVKAEQLVETTRRTAEADRAKQVALIEAAQQAETAAVHVTTQARAEREAAQMQATAIVELAEAARKKGLAEAEAQRALNDAINALSSDQTSLKFKLALLQALPAVIQQTVEPMKAIDGIKIIQVDGLNRNGAGSNGVDGVAGGGSGHNGTNLAEQAMSAALAYRAHAPLIDSLLKEVGLSGGSLQGLVPGLAANGVDAAAIEASAHPATPAIAQHGEAGPAHSSAPANGVAGQGPSYGPR
ncbi:MAG: flotillin family protein [Pseudomonadota bacterium]|uniref:flotillin family protein n=1 Tax=Burkholderiaceae TaxID=119060 RepID=UPI002016F1B2|nr:flotillin family protein [Burkholderia sp. 4M9327F10]